MLKFFYLWKPRDGWGLFNPFASLLTDTASKKKEKNKKDKKLKFTDYSVDEYDTDDTEYDEEYGVNEYGVAVSGSFSQFLKFI